jgi:hypothetical protein
MTHERLLQRNRKDAVQFVVEKRMRKNHTKGDELALLRKEIHHIEQALDITPTEEFSAYYNEAENAKAEAKANLG